VSQFGGPYIDFKFVGNYSNLPNFDLAELNPSQGRRLCLLSQRRGVRIAVHFAPFLAQLQSLCATEIPEHGIENYYQSLHESFFFSRDR
jgi:hypothetical protein